MVNQSMGWTDQKVTVAEPHFTTDKPAAEWH
jgi:hypothetical protein